MHMITACFARAPQRSTSRTYMHFLLIVQEVRPISKTRNQLNFFLTREDGTTAAERFFNQKPRSMFAAILASVELPPAPLSPPRRAEG